MENWTDSEGRSPEESKPGMVLIKLSILSAAYCTHSSEVAAVSLVHDNEAAMEVNVAGTAGVDLLR